MKGSKYSDEDRERAEKLLAAGKTPSEVAKEMGIAINTIRGWKKNFEETQNFAELRAEYKKQFEEQTSSIIDKGLTLIERRLDAAINYEEELDGLIEDYKNACAELGDDVDPNVIKKLVMKVATMKCDDVGKLSIMIATLFDKRALSQGAPTQNIGITFENLPETKKV